MKKWKNQKNALSVGRAAQKRNGNYHRSQGGNMTHVPWLCLSVALYRGVSLYHNQSI